MQPTMFTVGGIMDVPAALGDQTVNVSTLRWEDNVWPCVYGTSPTPDVLLTAMNEPFPGAQEGYRPHEHVHGVSWSGSNAA